jgi:hypothetical protein
MRAKRLRKPASWVSTQQLLAGLGIAQRHEAEVGQFELERVEQAHGDHLVALRQLAQRRSQPGSLRKSDTTKTVERRGISAGGGFQQVAQLGHALRGAP